MPPQDPDASLVATFKNHAILNDAKTAAEGRPIYDDMEIVEIRFPGSRSVSAFPATAMSHWVVDPQTGGQTKSTYAERFPRQYQQFKARAAQTKSGTPLAHVPFLTEARRAELRAQNIYTVEALAAIDGQELKNLGYNGRDLKNHAIAFIEDSKSKAINTQAQAELEALKARNEILEDDMKRLKDAQSAPDAADSKFDDMSLDQLREFIKSHTGQMPLGTMNRKTLIRMAMDVEPRAA